MAVGDDIQSKNRWTPSVRTSNQKLQSMGLNIFDPINLGKPFFRTWLTIFCHSYGLHNIMKTNSQMYERPCVWPPISLKLKHLYNTNDLYSPLLTYIHPYWPTFTLIGLHFALLTYIYPYLPLLTYIYPCWPIFTLIDLYSPFLTYIHPSWPTFTPIDLLLPSLLTECSASCSLDVVMKKCHSKRRCSVTASTEVFGDPCDPGTKKYLSVIYACGKFIIYFIFFFSLIVCFISYFVFSIAVLPDSPGVVYYHLLLRWETRISGVAPFSFRIGIWDLFVHRGQKSYTPIAFGKLWTTPGIRCILHASSWSVTPVWDRVRNRTGYLWISRWVLYHWANSPPNSSPRILSWEPRCTSASYMTAGSLLFVVRRLEP